MAKNRNKTRVGAGMKPRSGQTESRPAVQVEPVSAEVGQAENPKAPIAAPSKGERASEKRGSLEPELVQNLDLAEVALKDVPNSQPTLADLNPVVTAENEGLAALMQKSAEVVSGTEPVAPIVEASKNSIADIEAAINQGRIVSIEPNGEVHIPPGLGEQLDGTFVLAVTIPEGLIEPIRQQAESDQVTPEVWVSTRLQEYLESWWQPAPGR